MLQESADSVVALRKLFLREDCMDVSMAEFVETDCLLTLLRLGDQMVVVEAAVNQWSLTQRT